MGRTILHLIRYFLRLDEAQTQTSELERKTLAELAANKKRLAEIGVFEGRTTAVLARAMPEDAVLYAIDPFFPGRLGICWARMIARREVQRINQPRKVVFVERLSHQAVQEITGDLDFLFIDGDHSQTGLSRDWSDWSKRIQQGGIVALHDTHPSPQHPGSEAWESVCYFEGHIRHDPRFEVVLRFDLLSILRRRG